MGRASEVQGIERIGSRPGADPGTCESLLRQCAAAATAARGLPGQDRELAATLEECAMLCRATLEAIALQARTTRELRLICAAICHLCAEQCAARPERWAMRLSQLCVRCADACREVVALARPRSGTERFLATG